VLQIVGLGVRRKELDFVAYLSQSLAHSYYSRHYTTEASIETMDNV
jgi:hypothetical protein